MDRMEFLIFFKKPFWTGLCTRYTDDGIFSAIHVFGSEPTNGEITDFYLNHFDRLEFVRCDTDAEYSGIKKVSFKKSLHKGKTEQKKGTGRSLELNKAAMSKHLEEKKMLKKQDKREQFREKYLQKARKRKDKKRGH